MSSHRPPSIRDIVPGLGNSEEWGRYRALKRMQEPELTRFIGELGVEHGRIKSRRLNDPRFARYYAHHAINFLDEIERNYLKRLRAGLPLDDFFDAMKGYVNSRNSGSEGSRRRDEAEHIVHHVLALLVHDLRHGGQEKEKSSKNENEKEPRRKPDEGPSVLEGVARDHGYSDGEEGS